MDFSCHIDPAFANYRHCRVYFVDSHDARDAMRSPPKRGVMRDGFARHGNRHSAAGY
jgi:hypothetical protein